ncbi:MAG: 3D domain-containing protein [Candidatus Uhrbacteria bacterium]|nr:3D domain-containing protein [Candidatus Uhrbacteria bacterium]
MNSYLRLPHISLPKIKTISTLGVLVALAIVTMPTHFADADVVSAGQVAEEMKITFDDTSSTQDMAFELPTYTRVKVIRTYGAVPFSAYTSRPEETDDTPFITADGSHVADGIIAANFLKFGTKVRIPKLFGDKIFEVHDRMNKRYPYKIDIWMEGYKDAIQFGVKRADIEIVEVEVVNPSDEIAKK